MRRSHAVAAVLAVLLAAPSHAQIRPTFQRRVAAERTAPSENPVLSILRDAALALTDEQTARLREIAAELARANAPLQEEVRRAAALRPAGDASEARRRIRANTLAAAAQARALLTAEQRALLSPAGPMQGAPR
jgi:hypothetical protein